MDYHFKVITYFAIDKNYRGQGLGRELIEVIVDRAKTQDGGSGDRYLIHFDG